MEQLCPEAVMNDLATELEQGGNDVAAIDALLATYSNDPRLHFMKGSVLAGLKRPIEAHASLMRAVELAPEYHLARYQLGFFELTSGEADRALSTWGPLLRLPEQTYLRQFVEGMAALIRDEFADAADHFRKGISLNAENPPMNKDIGLLLAEAEKLAAGTSGDSKDDSELSATSFLLGQPGNTDTRH